MNTTAQKDNNASTDLVINLIGSFEPLDALIQHAQTNKKDIPVIQVALLKLNTLLYKVDPEVISALEYIKYLLLTNAKKPPDTPGALFTLLCQIKKDQIIICNPNYQQEMKLARPSIVPDSTV